MLKIALASVAMVLATGALADEVDVHAGPGPAVVAPGGADSKTVVHENDGAGCESKTVHKSARRTAEVARDGCGARRGGTLCRVGWVCRSMLVEAFD